MNTRIITQYLFIIIIKIGNSYRIAQIPLSCTQLLQSRENEHGQLCQTVF